MARVLSVASIVALLAAGAIAHPDSAHIARRGFGCGICGGYSFSGVGTDYGVNTGYGIDTSFGFGFPIALSFKNALNTNFNAANYNDNTVYLNNKYENAVNSNLNTFANDNVVFRPFPFQ